LVELHGRQSAQNPASRNYGLPAQLLERDRVLHHKRADGLAPQAGQVRPDPEPVAEVTGDGPDIGSGADLDSEGEEWSTKPQQLDSPHGDAHLGQLHLLPPARLGITALAADMLGRILG